MTQFLVTPFFPRWSALLAASLVFPLCHLSAEDGAISYANPPARVVWIEGEDAVKTNWTPGEARHIWWHEYAGTTGRGVLELSAPALPPEGAYTATYEFDLPAAGAYRLYWRGRFPGYQACPIYWSVNGAPERRQPAEGQLADSGILARALNMKVVLADLGEFKGRKGKNSLTIAVRDVMKDEVRVPNGGKSRTEDFVVQGIDSLLISKVKTILPPEELTVVSGQESPESSIPAMEADLDPGGGQFHGVHLQHAVQDWRGYDHLRLSVRAEGTGTEILQARLRCYYAGSQFIDLPVEVRPEDFGSTVVFDFDLNKAFGDISRAGIHLLWLYTSDAWHTKPGPVKLAMESLALTSRNAAGSQPIVVPPKGEPPPGLAAAKVKQVSEFVWNETSADKDSPASKGVMEDDPAKASVVTTAGDLRAEWSPVNGGLRKLSLGKMVLAQSPSAREPVGLQFLDKTDWMPSAPGTWKQEGDELVFWQSDKLARLELRIASRDGEIRIRPTIENLGEQPISRIRYSLWQGARMDGGTLLASTNRHPLQNLEAYVSKVSPQKFLHDWFCLYGKQATLHVRLEDRALLDSTARYGQNGKGVFVGIDKYPCIPPGKSWVAPEAVLGADRSGSWYQAAARFRTWFDIFAEKPPIPAWFKAIGGFDVDGVFYEEDAIAKNRVKLARMLKENGTSVLHGGDWLPFKTEGWYTLNYRLDDDQLANFIKIADDIRAQGGHLSIYTNALMISRVTKEFADYGKDLTVVASDGFPMDTEHDSRHHPMALPWPNARWANRYCDALEPVIAKGRPAILYMDQLGAVPTHLDYALERNGHEHYGQWRAVQKEFCETVEKRFRPLQPDLVTGIEGPNIAAQQVATFALIHYGDFEVFRVTFPHFVNFIGTHSFELPKDTILRFARDAFLCGQPLMFFHSVAANLGETTRAEIRDMLLCKRQIDPLLYGLRCQGADGITAPEGVRAFTFAGEKETVVTFVRESADAPRTVTLDPARTGVDGAHSAHVLNPDGTPGEELKFTPGASALTLEMPNTRFGMVLIKQ